MEQLKLNYQKHVLVCINDRESGDCCSKVKGNEVFSEIKSWVVNSGLSSRIWVTRTKCLGFCNDVGTTIVIYPEQKWFTKVTLDDIELIKTILKD